MCYNSIMKENRKNTAFWISPKGEIHPVRISHIDLICRYPEIFDVKEDYLRQRFAEFNEPWSFEGKARRIIMTELIAKGWIRLRFRPVPYYWICELWEKTPENEKWVLEALKDEKHLLVKYKEHMNQPSAIGSQPSANQ